MTSLEFLSYYFRDSEKVPLTLNLPLLPGNFRARASLGEGFMLLELRILVSVKDQRPIPEVGIKVYRDPGCVRLRGTGNEEKQTLIQWEVMLGELKTLSCCPL